MTNNDSIIGRETSKIYKAIAILIIIISHIGRYFQISFLYPLGAVGVAIFLFVSGYGLNESYKTKGRKNFIRKRFIKVYIPYIIVTILYSIITRTNVKTFVEYILMLQLPNGMYWFIKYIVSIYIIFFISTFIKDNKKRVILLAIIIVIFTLLNIDIRNYVWQIFSFILGVSVSQYSQVFKNFLERKQYMCIVISLICVFIAIVGKKMPYVEARETGVIDTILQIIITFNLSTVIMILIKTFKSIFLNKHIAKIFDYIGKISYELYLVHVFFFEIMKSKSIISILCYICTIIILAIIYHKFVDMINNKIEVKNESITHN